MLKLLLSHKLPLRINTCFDHQKCNIIKKLGVCITKVLSPIQLKTNPALVDHKFVSFACVTKLTSH